jgi:hypothetical protein
LINNNGVYKKLVERQLVNQMSYEPEPKIELEGLVNHDDTTQVAAEAETNKQE